MRCNPGRQEEVLLNVGNLCGLGRMSPMFRSRGLVYILHSIPGLAEFLQNDGERCPCNYVELQ